VDRLDAFHDALRSIFECLENVSMRYGHITQYIYVYNRIFIVYILCYIHIVCNAVYIRI
jgi:hypothetical protein